MIFSAPIKMNILQFPGTLSRKHEGLKGDCGSNGVLFVGEMTHRHLIYGVGLLACDM